MKHNTRIPRDLAPSPFPEPRFRHSFAPVLLFIYLFFLQLTAPVMGLATAPVLPATAFTDGGVSGDRGATLPKQAVPEAETPQRKERSGNDPARQPSQRREEHSEIERFIAGNVASPQIPDIRQFGYDLFDQPPSTFAPVQNVPVGPDYVIGPGDGLRIEVWGKVEGTWNVVVDSDGNVVLPKAGVLGVAGLTFREVKEVLAKELAKYYTGFEMNVSMGPLRTIRIYIVGNARRPGAYTISSLSTIINALFDAGGASKTGSLRNIQVKRSGRTVVVFDLYDFLLKGDKSKDIRLLPEDVIFIPPVGPLAGIAGTVKTPAIYELKGETRLLDLIEMAGGLTCVAFTGRVQMQRIEDHHLRATFDGDLIDVEKVPEKNLLLQDGDVARISAVADIAKTVRISGAVIYPGEYGVKPGVTRVRDVIALAGGLLYFASNQAEATRLTASQDGPKTEIFSIDLGRALAGDEQQNILLQMNDHLFVRSVPEWDLYRQVTLSGEVRFPGAYTIRKGEPLSSLIERAGGFTDKAYLKGAVFTREKVRLQQQQQISEMAERLERELLGSGAAQVATASSPDEAKLAQMEMEQKRSFINQLRAARAKGRIALRLAPLQAFRGSAFDIELEQGDSLVIPADPKVVQVIGSVYNQSAFVFEKSKPYGAYLQLAGGCTANADRGNIYILKADGFAARANNGLFSADGRIESGDTIVVPEQLERVAWMRNVKDITQILYQIAVSAGVLIVVF